MITESQLNSVLESVLRDDADAAVGSINISSRVRKEMARSGNVRFQPARRVGIVVGVAVAALALSAVAAVAVSSENSPIRIHWHRVPTSAQGTPVDMTMEKPYETTVSEAEQRIGFHVMTLDGYSAAKTPVKMPDGRMQSVVFHPPVTAVNGQPIAHNTGAIGLYYTINGDRIEIVEQLDPNGSGPLDVHLKQPDHPVPGISTIKVETINGAEYLVSRSPSNGGIVGIEWKTSDGVLMRINCDRPLSTEVVVSVIHHLH